jgi:hypothetical protein
VIDFRTTAQIKFACEWQARECPKDVAGRGGSG